MNPHDPISIFKTDGAYENCIDIQKDSDGAVMIMICASGQKNYATFESEKDLIYWIMDYIFFEEAK